MTWPRSTVSIILVTAISLFLIAFHRVPFGAPSVWEWQYLPLGEPARIVFPLIALGIFAAVIHFPVRSLWLANQAPGVSRRREGKCLFSLWAACVSMALSVALMHPLGFWHLTSLVINPASNSYYSTALVSEASAQLLNNYHEKMPNYVAHAQTQSAGPVVLCSILHRTFSHLPFTHTITETLLALSPGISLETAAQQANAAWKTSLSPIDASIGLLIALAIISLGSMAVVPIYYLSKWLYDSQTGIVAASLWVLLPSFHSFTVSVDQMYPLLSGLVLCSIFQGLRLLSGSTKTSVGLAVVGIGGVVNGIGLFFNVGLLMLLPLGLCFALLLRPTATNQRMGTGALIYLLGCLIPLLFLKISYGFDWLAVFRTSNQLNYELHYSGTRSYLVSLFSNLWDFFTFAGAPIAGYFLLRAYRLGVTKGTDLDNSKAGLFLSAPLLWAVVLTLLLLDLSGKTRGEVARMWMLLYPAVLIEASVEINQLARQTRWILPSMLALQWLWIVTIAYNVRVWGY